MRNNNYKYIIENELVFIDIYQTNGTKHTTIIDLFNLEKFLSHKYSWGVAFHKCVNKYYVVSTVYNKEIKKGKRIYLHNFLLDFPEAEHIDHENNNTLDNRESNLRKSKARDNLKNRENKNSNNKSGYRNVCWVHNHWRVQVQIDKKNHIFPEKFTDVDEAGKFAEEMRKKYYGEFAGGS